ncbi:hypothetical protein NVP1152O_060 [Vibrio phage 1.152.O._10N.222.46.E1]|uniref:Uncharacterized protein n=4 Tax=Nahantvirus 49C7 TaxID=2846601 RepID=A0A2I7RBE1_9CAUD|nr:hypothetical protein NVP1025O_059 [Vibrio phage 1.025.O._10N.222.46.B6]AUR90792.1 hypothetical protein NVP1150O_059 [Vibrio phage 1.150.O._10N.222.46.A6]AUR90965.1 hypothetical protein NVP1152O_060 [Vibrio phage 1.152.O._10N.222.46.E1]AUS02433.1 hypothetical protein NVP2130O_059 [Vibrio phage 2.130.O._10N.222.46.C2]
MNKYEITLKRLENLKPMLLSMDSDIVSERNVCAHNPKATQRAPGGSVTCLEKCDECVFGVDVTWDSDGNVIKYGNLEEVIDELKLLSLLEV